MKLYWKIYLFLALTTLASLILSLWLSFSFLPRWYDRERNRRLDQFEAVVASRGPSREAMLFLADSLAVSVHFVGQNRQIAHGQPPAPPRDRDWRGARLVAVPDAGYAVLAAARIPPPRLVVLIPLALMLFLSQAVALFLGLRPVFRRTKLLTGITGDFGRGNLGLRYPEQSGSDEIDLLGASFNSMAERINTLLASHTELLSSVAHELRTPLARLGFALELARQNPDSAREKLSLMEKDLQQLDRLVSELLELNRIGAVKPEMKPVSVHEICTTAADAERLPGGCSSVSVSVPDAGLMVKGDLNLLVRALANLVRNGVTHGSGQIRVAAAKSDGLVVISVQDEGTGFPQGFCEKAMKPFLKGRGSEGSGLGLSIAARIAEAHGGRLELTNPAEGGARATLYIPA